MKDLSYKANLPIEAFVTRRQQLAKQLPENSLCIVFSAQEQTRNADCTYIFRQDSYFWYLTGFNEPDSALVLIKHQDDNVEMILFVRPSDPEREIWDGRRLGVDNAPQTLNVDRAYSIDHISKELPQLLQGITALYCGAEVQAWGDKIIAQALHTTRSQRQLSTPPQIVEWRPLIDEMRLFKSEDEIALLQQAAQISALAHMRAMKETRPNRYEYEIEGELLHEFNRHGARFAAYNSIVAGGENACILHYTENDAQLKDGDLVLIDAGAEFAMYAGDITRTFPVNGQFSEAQKAIYNIVLAAEKRAIELLVPGATIAAVNDVVIKMMLQGLIDLGILQGDCEQLFAEQAHLPFYMHGLGHWLGLDVHDVGASRADRHRPLEVGMVMTVEPGLYLSEKLAIPEQYKGIGIRIEDDIVITEYGNKILTSAVPKEIDDIEALMQSE